jgi:hypothetical protein
MSRGLLRVVGFLLLMIGFGLRLDTAWQGLAWVVLVAGALAAAGAFVPPRVGR